MGIKQAEPETVRRSVIVRTHLRGTLHCAEQPHHVRESRRRSRKMQESRRIEEARVPADGLEGHFLRELGRAADLKEAMLGAYCEEL